MTATYVDVKTLESDVQAIVEAGHPELSANALSNLLDLATDANTETARAHWSARLSEYGVTAPVREDYVREVEDTPAPVAEVDETPEGDESDTDD